MPAARIRVGWGYDAHAFGGDPPLILGGVVFSETTGVSATSDGDVLAHAVNDAVLGACVLADMGEHFPSDDAAMAGTDSMHLLRRAAGLARDAGWQTDHVDATLLIEEIRIAPHRDLVRANLADALGIDVDSVSVKATTTDGLGFIGRGEGLAAVAVVTVTALP
ncbi:MAG TPA: 2-C-methyl-D-erythritol 2,4-cyclodiphosphate synthase [Acidimicrobiia bacterium]|nr:2-C-methyl-D-erythritol 2,4-cyclodiphosphate synthase [Acidimicrobiia bacterium]